MLLRNLYSHRPGPGSHLTLLPPSSAAASVICSAAITTIVCMQMFGKSNQNRAGTMLHIASDDLHSKWLFLLLKQRRGPPPGAHYPH